MPYRDTVRSFMPDSVQQAIHDACETLGGNFSELEQNCSPDISPQDIEYAVVRLISAPDLWAQSNRNLSHIRVQLLLFNVQLGETEALIEFFERTAP